MVWWCGYVGWFDVDMVVDVGVDMGVDVGVDMGVGVVEALV